MSVILKVIKDVGDYKGYFVLSNKFVKLHVPKRSYLLNGRKLLKGESYELTLNTIKPKKKNNPTKKKVVKKKPKKKK